MYVKYKPGVLLKLQVSKENQGKESKFGSTTGLLMYDSGNTHDIYQYSTNYSLLSSFCSVDTTVLSRFSFVCFFGKQFTLFFGGFRIRAADYFISLCA